MYGQWPSKRVHFVGRMFDEIGSFFWKLKKNQEKEFINKYLVYKTSS